jgi:predicted small lipoprotein YifL
LKKPLALLLITLSALAVTACGLRGDLERPPPLLGEPDPADEAEDSEG